MKTSDVLSFTAHSIRSRPFQSLLSGLGIAVGIAAVIFLTSIGEGIHRFVLAEFSQFGTNLIAVNPGRVTTFGTPLGVLGTVRILTIEDAESLKSIPNVLAVVPSVQGNAEVESDGVRRRTTVLGVNHQVPEAFRLQVAAGEFLPPDDPRTPRSLAVLGNTVARELFRHENPLGRFIRAGGARFRVVGIMESKGQMLGIDLDDAVYVPTARALDLFNREGLMEIDCLYADDVPPKGVVAHILRILADRHGQEDFTITTQQQMLDILGSVLSVLTIAVGALGGISLAVGAIGILTVMIIAVGERTNEIGILRAIGATRKEVQAVFLVEAAFIGAAGGVMGLVLGVGGTQLMHAVFSAIPVHTPWEAIVLAQGIAAFAGLLSGIYPAWRSGRLDPIEALRSE